MGAGASLPVGSTLRLPPGRYRAQWDDVVHHWGFNPHRRALLEQAQKFVAAVGSVLPVCSVWIFGSLLTDKPAPDDFDVVFVLNTDALHAPPARALATPEALCGFAESIGLKADAYLLPWASIANPSPRGTDRDLFAFRGYWDDWLTRERQVPKGEAPTRACTLPRRGYVEVIVHGFQ